MAEAETGKLRVTLCAPEKEQVSLDADAITAPGSAGIFTVLPGHTPLLSTLIPGVVVAETKQEAHFYAISGGVAEVRDNEVTLLAEAFEYGFDVDTARATAAKDRAEARLEKASEDTDVRRAEIALRKAMARLQASQRKFY